MTELVDQHNRKVDYLRVSVTDRCNLRCTYCMPADGIQLITPKNVLRYEEVLRVARVAAESGVTKVRVTGGEPLVRKGITGFIAELASIPGLIDISLTTNGILLSDFATELKRAGLARVNVSLDTLRPERYKKITRSDGLGNVLAGLRAAHDAGLTPVKVNMVVIKGFNDDEVRDFALLTKKEPYHVRFIEYMPFDVEAGWKKEDCIPTSELIRMVEKIAPLKDATDRSKGAGPARRFRFEDAKGELGFISPVSEHFCSSCNRLRLTADGKLRTCLFSDTETDLRTALRDGSTDDAIREIMFSSLKTKPTGHKIGENLFKKCSRTMSLIGG